VTLLYYFISQYVSHTIIFANPLYTLDMIKQAHSEVFFEL